MTFREWINRIYGEYLVEGERECFSTMTPREYFNQYKWWLKRRYKETVFCCPSKSQSKLEKTL